MWEVLSKYQYFASGWLKNWGSGKFKGVDIQQRRWPLPVSSVRALNLPCQGSGAWSAFTQALKHLKFTLHWKSFIYFFVMKGGNLYSELYAYVKRLFAYVVCHTHLLPGWAAAAREKASVLSLTFTTRMIFPVPRHCFSSTAVFSSLSLFLWTLSECRFSGLRQLGGRTGPGRAGQCSCGVPALRRDQICGTCLSRGSRPGAPRPVSCLPAIGSARSRENRGLEFWVVAPGTPFLFFFLKSLGRLSSAGLGASLSDWGWRQTETATRADWGGRRKSVGMLSQGPRTPASGCYYLNAMTPEGQEMYLRFDQTTRRSPYRMSRILARHQLVTKIQQGESLVAEGCC